MKHKSFHRPPPAPFFVMLEEARHLIGDLSSQVLIHCISAHYRSGHVSIAQASKACSMSEDDFRRAQTTVDDEARRMMLETERLQKEREERLAALEKPTPKLTCSNCKTNAAEESHSCPYKAEINDDEKTKCDCCADCRQDCADDI